MTDYSKRENCPLEVGEIVIDETGERMTFIDWPTDGPLFELPDVEPIDPEDDAAYVQLGADEFAELYENGDLERQ